MSDAFKLGFAPFAAPARIGASGVLIVFCDDGLKFGPATAKVLGAAAGLVARAAKAERFTGKNGTALDLIVPEGLKVARLVVIGVGKTASLQQKDLLKLGGLAMGKLPLAASEGLVFAELPNGALKAEQAADLALGIVLRAYAFDRYKTKRKDDEKPPAKRSVMIAVGDVAAARKAYATREAIGGGVLMARDLVNEPANVLYPEEFARRTGALKKVWRHGRSARPQGDEEARHECAARRRPGLRTREPRGGDALERRQSGRCAGRLHRQGRVLRHRRHLDQAGGRHGGHEGRHGGRGLRHRPDAGAGRAQSEGQRGRRHRPGREHAGR